MSKILIYTCQLVVLALVSVQFINCQAQQGQYFKIWFTQGCQGEANATKTSTSNVTVGVLNPTIYFRVNGLWTSETCTLANCTNRQIRTGAVGTGCNSLSIPVNSDSVRVTMFGDVNQNKTVLHFFTETNLLGIDTIVTEAGHNQLTITARSYYFEGPHSWDINNGAVCLNHTSTVSQNRYGITFNGNANLSPQVVKFECRASTQPPGTTTTASPITTRTTTTASPITTRTTTTINPNSTRSTTPSSGFKSGIDTLAFLLVSISLLKNL